MADRSRQYILAKRPNGKPDRDCFELERSEIPQPSPNQVLVRTLYLSVDPYMRGRMDEGESYAANWGLGEPLRGHVVGKVVDSEHARWSQGELVYGQLRWADYAIANGNELRSIDPDIAPLPAHLGVLGMPGRTAYFGMLEVADPAPSETVVVSGAAGAVGSIAGQIASLAGCRVVGFAGTDEKVAFLEDELGFDVGINYQTTDDYRAALEEAAQAGVDVYFDNVGGPITDAVFDRLCVDARVAVCGQIAHYNARETPTGPRKLPQLIANRATVEGFLVGDFEPRFETATERLSKWVAEGSIEHRETIVEGLERAPEAFLGLFDGDNIGKQVVNVADPNH